MTGKEEKQDMQKPRMRHRYLFALIYGLALTGYAVFTILYVFVIPHGTVSMEEAVSSLKMNTEVSSTAERLTEDERYSKADDTEIVEDVAAENTGTEQDTFFSDAENASVYEDSGLKVTMTTEYIYDTKVYIADVVLTDGNMLLTGLAGDSFGRNVTEKTSDIASRVGAVLAVNGDFYGFRDEGYVIRNGYLYRSEKSDDDAEDFVVYADGSCEIIREGDISAEELLEKGAVQVYSFGPALVEDGSITVSEGDEVGKSMSSNPRTAIGYVSKDHFVLVVSDGRTDESEGLSLKELAEVMADAGCVCAYNLDGGGSTTMYYKGEVYNNPTTNGRIKERKVSDIVYIK